MVTVSNHNQFQKVATEEYTSKHIGCILVYHSNVFCTTNRKTVKINSFQYRNRAVVVMVLLVVSLCAIFFFAFVVKGVVTCKFI